jgi:hypothetical protein
MQVEEEIKRNLFLNQKWDYEMRELVNALNPLEETIEWMMMLDDSTMDKGRNTLSHSGEDDNPIWNGLDSRFEHSWTPSGTPSGALNGHGLGWYWIPKGRICLDITYPVRTGEVRRFGHAAKKIRATFPPHDLTKSFMEVVRLRGMAQPNCFMGKRWQEEWIEEDDLLGGELGQEQDLWRQL